MFRFEQKYFKNYYQFNYLNFNIHGYLSFNLLFSRLNEFNIKFFSGNFYNKKKPKYIFSKNYLFNKNLKNDRTFFKKKRTFKKVWTEEFFLRRFLIFEKMPVSNFIMKILHYRKYWSLIKLKGIWTFLNFLSVSYPINYFDRYQNFFDIRNSFTNSSFPTFKTTFDFSFKKKNLTYDFKLNPFYFKTSSYWKGSYKNFSLKDSLLFKEKFFKKFLLPFSWNNFEKTNFIHWTFFLKIYNRYRSILTWRGRPIYRNFDKFDLLSQLLRKHPSYHYYFFFDEFFDYLFLKRLILFFSKNSYFNLFINKLLKAFFKPLQNQFNQILNSSKDKFFFNEFKFFFSSFPKSFFSLNNENNVKKFWWLYSLSLSTSKQNFFLWDKQFNFLNILSGSKLGYTSFPISSFFEPIKFWEDCLIDNLNYIKINYQLMQFPKVSQFFFHNYFFSKNNYSFKFINLNFKIFLNLFNNLKSSTVLLKKNFKKKLKNQFFFNKTVDDLRLLKRFYSSPFENKIILNSHLLNINSSKLKRYYIKLSFKEIYTYYNYFHEPFSYNISLYKTKFFFFHVNFFFLKSLEAINWLFNLNTFKPIIPISHFKLNNQLIASWIKFLFNNLLFFNKFFINWKKKWSIFITSSLMAKKFLFILDYRIQETFFDKKNRWIIGLLSNFNILFPWVYLSITPKSKNFLSFDDGDFRNFPYLSNKVFNFLSTIRILSNNIYFKNKTFLKLFYFDSFLSKKLGMIFKSYNIFEQKTLLYFSSKETRLKNFFDFTSFYYSFNLISNIKSNYWVLTLKLKSFSNLEKLDYCSNSFIHSASLDWYNIPKSKDFLSFSFFFRTLFIKYFSLSSNFFYYFLSYSFFDFIRKRNYFLKENLFYLLKNNFFSFSLSSNFFFLNYIGDNFLAIYDFFIWWNNFIFYNFENNLPKKWKSFSKLLTLNKNILFNENFINLVHLKNKLISYANFFNLSKDFFLPINFFTGNLFNNFLSVKLRSFFSKIFDYFFVKRFFYFSFFNYLLLKFKLLFFLFVLFHTNMKVISNLIFKLLITFMFVWNKTNRKNNSLNFKSKSFFTYFKSKFFNFKLVTPLFFSYFYYSSYKFLLSDFAFEKKIFFSKAKSDNKNLNLLLYYKNYIFFLFNLFLFKLSYKPLFFFFHKKNISFSDLINFFSPFYYFKSSFFPYFFNKLFSPFLKKIFILNNHYLYLNKSNDYLINFSIIWFFFYKITSFNPILKIKNFYKITSFNPILKIKNFYKITSFNPILKIKNFLFKNFILFSFLFFFSKKRIKKKEFSKFLSKLRIKKYYKLPIKFFKKWKTIISFWKFFFNNWRVNKINYVFFHSLCKYPFYFLSMLIRKRKFIFLFLINILRNKFYAEENYPNKLFLLLWLKTVEFLIKNHTKKVFNIFFLSKLTYFFDIFFIFSNFSQKFYFFFNKIYEKKKFIEKKINKWFNYINKLILYISFFFKFLCFQNTTKFSWIQIIFLNILNKLLGLLKLKNSNLVYYYSGLLLNLNLKISKGNKPLVLTSFYSKSLNLLLNSIAKIKSTNYIKFSGILKINYHNFFINKLHISNTLYNNKIIFKNIKLFYVFFFTKKISFFFLWELIFFLNVYLFFLL